MRILTFLVATAFCRLIILYPRAIATEGSLVPHGWLVLALLGVSFAWVYGLGFIPKHPILRCFFHPVTAWLCMGTGAFMIFAR